MLGILSYATMLARPASSLHRIEGVSKAYVYFESVNWLIWKLYLDYLYHRERSCEFEFLIFTHKHLSHQNHSTDWEASVVLFLRGCLIFLSNILDSVVCALTPAGASKMNAWNLRGTVKNAAAALSFAWSQGHGRALHFASAFITQYKAGWAIPLCPDFQNMV